MTTKLVILGLLQEKPLYGYEIKQIIEEHMGDWTNIAFGSIYFALNKLEKAGFIEKTAVEQDGNRPSRSVYQITDHGQTEFLQLLRGNWENIERHYYAIDIGLFFAHALPPEEIRGYLQKRVAHLEAATRYLTAHQATEINREEVPAVAAAIFNHTRVHLEAELTWSRELLQKFESGEYL